MEKMMMPSRYLALLAKRGRKSPTGWQKDFAKIIHERSKQKAKSVI
jgi:hypothetical protein